MSWFSALTGIDHETPKTVKDNLSIEGTALVSHANSRRFEIGTLTTPSLADLRNRSFSNSRAMTLSEVVADVQALYLDPVNAGAVFQVASQFNLLEMIDPSVSPEDGVTRYQHDLTQGPASAIACGAGTIYRNYFHPVQNGIGQSSSRQIDCLDDVGGLLGNKEHRFWDMQNGYALADDIGLNRLNEAFDQMREAQFDRLRDALRIGVQADTEVTIGDAGHLVTQTYCSALPVAYGTAPDQSWQCFATLILEGSYEATFRAAIENAQRTGNNRLFLTLLGGGAFGNRSEWIVAAILRSLRMFRFSGLDVVFVSYGAPNPLVADIISEFQNTPR